MLLLHLLVLLPVVAVVVNALAAVVIHFCCCCCYALLWLHQLCFDFVHAVSRFCQNQTSNLQPGLIYNRTAVSVIKVGVAVAVAAHDIAVEVAIAFATTNQYNNSNHLQ